MRYLFAILLCSILFNTLPLHGYAETEIFDYSDNLSDYAQAVALLNRPIPASYSFPETEHYLSALMCSTDGSAVDFSPVSALYILEGPNHCFTLFFETAQERDAAVNFLNQTNGVRYAEADGDVFACGEAEYTFQSWGAEEMGFGEYADYVDTYGSGSAVIAVIDSGCFPHSLMQDRIIQETPDLIDGDLDPSNDLFGHGTAVAGIIADCTQNMPVYIYPIRVLGSGGTGKISNVVNAVRHAATVSSVINLSLESSTMSQSLDEAIREAIASGVTVVVAAGNSGCDTANVCPAHLTDAGVIVVGACEGRTDAWQRASYSNYGESVDVYAFGSNIRCCSRSGGYTTESGTSMAAPHISANCAMMQLLHHGLRPEEAELRLQMSAEDENHPLPNLTQMIPQLMSFSLGDIRMCVGQKISLPTPLPKSACEKITLDSSNKTVVHCEGDVLTAVAPGTAEITCTCVGLETAVFRITVVEYEEALLYLPSAVRSIEAEAFQENPMITGVILPETVCNIGDCAFDGCSSLDFIHIPALNTIIGENTFSNAVIVCRLNSDAHSYAVEEELQYIAFSEFPAE